MIAAARLDSPVEVAVTERDSLADFDDVYRSHADAVYRYCVSQLGDPSRAEDAAAEAFSSALAAYRRTRPDGEGVRPWLFRIARNACVDERRHDGRILRLRLRLVRRPQTHGDVESVAALRAEVRAVVSALQRLDERARQLLGLRIAAGLSHAEIAAVSGTSEAAARQAVHRALAKVRLDVEERS